MKSEIERSWCCCYQWLSWVLRAGGVLFVVVVLWSSLWPASFNWGYNFLGFLPRPAMVVVLLAMGAILFPAVQRQVIAGLAAVVSWFTGMRGWVKFIMAPCLLTGAVAVFWYFREANGLLGDGMLLGGVLSNIKSPADIPHNYGNAPLTVRGLWELYRALSPSYGALAGEYAVRYFSVVAGVLAVVLAYRCARAMTGEKLDQLLAFLFILAAPASQLYFGYLESYALPSAMLVLFYLAAYRYLDGRWPLWVPCLVCGVIVACHFCWAYYAPLGAFLCLHAILVRRCYGQVAVSVIGTALMALVLSWAGGSPPSFLLEQSGASHLLSWEQLSTGWHAVNLLNAFPFVSGLALLLVVGVLPPRGGWLSAATFSLLSVVNALLFLGMVNFDIGMSRDSDLISAYGLTLVIPAAWYWINCCRDAKVRRSGLLVVIWLMGLHTASFIWVNSRADASVARFRVLPDARLWHHNEQSMAYAHQMLGHYFRGRGQYDLAKPLYQKAIEDQPQSSIRWFDYAQNCLPLRDYDGFVTTLRTAIAKGVKDEALYVVLGDALYQLGRPNEARVTWAQGLKAFPSSVPLRLRAQANVGGPSPTR